MDLASIIVSALAALAGAAIGGYATYRGALIRYDALVNSTYKREWIGSLRSAAAEFVGEAHLFSEGYFYHGGMEDDQRSATIRSLGISKSRVQILLDRQNKRQLEASKLCNRIYRRCTNPRSAVMDRDGLAEDINSFADIIEVIGRSEWLRVRRAK